MTKSTLQQDALRRRLARIGAEHFANAKGIETIKANIERNRKGELELTKVAIDEQRVARRVAREGLSHRDALERVNGVADFQDVSIVGRMLGLSRAVCRVLIGSAQGSSGYGTGFLIAPGVMITNHHVLPDAATASRSFAQFNYELDTSGSALTPVSFRILPGALFITSTVEKQAGDQHSGLDFTMVAVEPVNAEGRKLDDWGHVRLDGSLGKIVDGETCAVIQHPEGDYKKIVLKDIRMITLTEDTLLYESDTRPGSSGSPVFGMGTCEVVALHHTGVPRMDDQGNWLKKDGSIVGPGDADSDIDWIGNEGIRISRIIDAVRHAQIADGMNTLRDRILSAGSRPAPPAPPPSPAPNTAVPVATSASTTARVLRFEVLLATRRRMRDAWASSAADLVVGFVSDEPLFPTSTDPFARRLHYLTVRREGDPWAIAEEIEQLPHVVACTPDLPTPTYMEPDSQERAATEGNVPDVIYDDGTGKHNEERFLDAWREAKLIKDMNGDRTLIRNWNWAAIKHPGIDGLDPVVRQAVITGLPRLRFTQLDTGYSAHTKVHDGLDLERDLDVIDGDSDASDPMHGFGFKHPGHGTRTASLAVGGSLRDDPKDVDGNRGVLREADGTLRTRLIPYRVAERVVLIGSGKDMVEGARHAIGAGSDVIFMCMGSYPRPMIEVVAREAYDRGVIWVCAAGNEVEVVVAPAMYPGTIAVAAINPRLDPWRGSSNGPVVDIAAPGEDVYVPILDEHRNESMSYGNGTSYATPHVASAAVLWKARWIEELKQYTAPWQIVEAFRWCVRNSAKPHNPGTRPGVYGAGILDVTALLNRPLPKVGELKYAYEGITPRDPDDLGIREGLHYLWRTLRRKLSKDPTESTAAEISPRARAALDALGAMNRPSRTEGALPVMGDREKVLRELFQQPLPSTNK